MSTEQELRRELLVWGYIRNAEKQYQIENIPEDINNIILLFQKVCDLWDREYSNTDDLEIHQDGSVFTVADKHWPTAYGKAVVKEGIYVWQLRIEEMASDDEYREGPFVGVIQNTKEYLMAYEVTDGWDQCGYQWASESGQLYTSMREGDGIESQHDYWYKEGDVLKITLDMNALTLTFIVNDNQEDAASFSNIAKNEYRLALTLENHQGAKFRLL